MLSASARRPRRRRKESPAAASRRPHRSASARSRYMRRRSDAVVGRRLPVVASAPGIARGSNSKPWPPPPRVTIIVSSLLAFSASARRGASLVKFSRRLRRGRGSRLGWAGFDAGRDDPVSRSWARACLRFASPGVGSGGPSNRRGSPGPTSAPHGRCGSLQF